MSAAIAVPTAAERLGIKAAVRERPKRRDPKRHPAHLVCALLAAALFLVDMRSGRGWFSSFMLVVDVLVLVSSLFLWFVRDQPDRVSYVIDALYITTGLWALVSANL